MISKIFITVYIIITIGWVSFYYNSKIKEIIYDDNFKIKENNINIATAIWVSIAIICIILLWRNV
jgi:hypothetical protein